MSGEMMKKIKVYLVKCTFKLTGGIYYNASQKQNQNCMTLTSDPQFADHLVRREDAQNICDHFKRVDVKQGFDFEVEEMNGYV